MSDYLHYVLLLLSAATIGIAGIAAWAIYDTDRDHTMARERARKACEGAGGVYVVQGVQYRGNTFYCIAPPVPVEATNV